MVAGEGMPRVTPLQSRILRQIAAGGLDPRQVRREGSPSHTIRTKCLRPSKRAPALHKTQDLQERNTAMTTHVARVCVVGGEPHEQRGFETTI